MSQSVNSPMQTLLAIMAQLRDSEKGCEWDKAQSFDSIKYYTLEETYEVLDAIEQKDFSALKNELGDLLFQIVFYSQLAKEQQLFSFDDVCQSVNHKLISRHPHVFAHQQYDKCHWESIKQQERDAREQFSVLDDIPVTQPALMRAEKIQKRCAAVGFDWDDVSAVFDKVYEEIDEVKAELVASEKNQHKIAEEVGDLLFAVVNLARHLGVKSELALKSANNKFERRFKAVERHFQLNQKSLQTSSLDEMESVWQQVKLNELN